MAEKKGRKVDLETLKGTVDLAGLGLSEDRLKEILPTLQAFAAGMEELRGLDVHEAEPAVTFRARQR